MKGKLMKKNHVLTWAGIFSLLLLLQTTVLGGYYLPTSSIWQGGQYYGSSSDDIYAYIEYAVYSSSDLPDEIAGLTDETSTTDTYVYVYQIFNLGSDISDLAIASVILSGGDTSASSYIGSLDDDNDGITPDSSEIDTTDSTYVWEFTGGLLIVDAQSVFLVFTSNYAPTEGTITLSTEYGDEIPVTSTDSTLTSVPEPGTIILLLSGAYLSYARKKTSKRN